MSEPKDAVSSLVRDVRFIFPLVGTILVAIVLLEFDKLGRSQELAPVLIIYTLTATLISWLHASAVYIYEEFHGKELFKKELGLRWTLTIVASFLHLLWIGVVVYFLHWKKIF